MRHALCGLLYCRPQRLLVFVNPFGGKRQARRTWTQLAEPILTAAGVACSLMETQYQVCVYACRQQCSLACCRWWCSAVELFRGPHLSVVWAVRVADITAHGACLCVKLLLLVPLLVVSRVAVGRAMLRSWCGT